LNTSAFLAVGRIVGVHGIKGEVKVFSYSESSSVFRPGKIFLCLNPPDRNQSPVSDNLILHEIIRAKPHKQGFLVLLKGISSRNEAEAWVGAEFFVQRASLPEPEEGTYYWADLIGLAVFTNEELYLGQVEAIFPTGSNDVYVVKDGDKETLIPALASVVTGVDLENRVMRVNLPEGLLALSS